MRHPKPCQPRYAHMGFDDFTMHGPDEDGLVTFAFRDPRTGSSRATLIPQAEADREIEAYLERRLARKVRDQAQEEHRGLG